MKIRVVGGFGSEQMGCNLTAFLINGRVLLDAGTISSALTAREQAAITHVVLSHAHLDHTRGIPFLADNIAGSAKPPVQIAAIGDVIDVVKGHLLNGRLWPDFTRIPSAKQPALKYRRLAVGRERKLLAGLSVRPVCVSHTVPTTGFIIREGKKAIVYSGDTGATEGIWKAAARLGGDLKAVLIEASFPNRMRDVADRSGHLTPRGMGAELDKIEWYKGPVYVYHVKCRYLTDIEREIDALDRKDIIVVRDGMEWEI